MNLNINAGESTVDADHTLTFQDATRGFGVFTNEGTSQLKSELSAKTIESIRSKLEEQANKHVFHPLVVIHTVAVGRIQAFIWTTKGEGRELVLVLNMSGGSFDAHYNVNASGFGQWVVEVLQDLHATFYVPRGSSMEDDMVNKVNVEYMFWVPGAGVQKEKYIKVPDTSLVDEMYEHVDPVLLCKEFIKAKESLLFMHGKPGVGKSTIIKYLMNELATSKWILKPIIDGWRTNDTSTLWYIKDLQVLESDFFWTKLLSREPEIVVLDDFMKGLQKGRDGSRSTFVEKLLSISDGIFSVRTKFVVTTNLEKAQVDEALVRPGRCYDFVEMEELSPEYASSLWQKLSPEGVCDLASYLKVPKLAAVPQSLFRQSLDEVRNNSPRTYHRK